ncbi:hypothetical protein FB451DRAFT_968220, partial [Mycena latifolia]
QLSEWPWDSVASNSSFGYGYAQVRPASEHSKELLPYTDYQPVSYILPSKRGTRDQFANMISTCQTAGVGIIVD